MCVWTHLQASLLLVLLNEVVACITHVWCLGEYHGEPVTGTGGMWGRGRGQMSTQIATPDSLSYLLQLAILATVQHHHTLPQGGIPGAGNETHVHG